MRVRSLATAAVTLVLSAFVLIGTTACRPTKQGGVFTAVDGEASWEKREPGYYTAEFKARYLDLLAPYMSDRTRSSGRTLAISDEAPADGIYSPVEAIIETEKDLLRGGQLDPSHEPIASYPYLMNSRVDQPVLVHDFREPLEEEFRSDFWYVLTATHPQYGMTAACRVAHMLSYPDQEYVYTVDTVGAGFAGEEYSYIADLQQTKSYIAKRLGEGTLERDPIAVYLPIAEPSSYYQFLWYFEAEQGGTGNEYLFDPYIGDYQPGQDIQSQLGGDSRSFLTPSRISKPDIPLDLYAKVERRRSSSRSTLETFDSVTLSPYLD